MILLKEIFKSLDSAICQYTSINISKVDADSTSQLMKSFFFYFDKYQQKSLDAD